MEYYAHSKDGERGKEFQLLGEHLKKVAKLSQSFADDFSSGKWAYWAGLWHDVGKYSIEFQNRLGLGVHLDEHVKQFGDKVDHSTAGAKHANTSLGNYGKVLAYPIAGHHTGLPNGKDDTDSCLFNRLNKNIPDWSGCPDKILKPNPLDQLPFIPDIKRKRLGFQASFFIRMIYSCLVDADFLDTEQFMDPDRSKYRQGCSSTKELYERLIQYQEKMLAEAIPTSLNKHRAEILFACLNAAEKAPGLFSLTVPTGGGKTLSSLAFALKHALQHDLKRIIYVIPYTSIIEQNAAVFREVLGDDYVLEHHSNFETKDLSEEDQHFRLAAENWDAPVIVTTNVQFFESLFHNRSSKCRRIHNIAKSVVILDEAQMLPLSFLNPCLEALKELASVYKTTIVLCTATQPALSSNKLKYRLDQPFEIINDPVQLYQVFKRVKAHDLGEMTDDEIAERLSSYSKALCIVNTRKHARRLYEKVAGVGCFHLSALMCPAHRSEKIVEIKAALSNSEHCRVISTQLIEAGVDIDFPVVFRSIAGLDSIAQAAGRCNREGRLPEGGHVYVFMPEDGLPLGDFRFNADTAEIVMRHHEDLLSPEAITEYFETNYWLRGNDELDREGILSDLWEGTPSGDFPFKTVAGKFRIIQTGMEPVVIPFNKEAEDLIQRLRYAENPKALVRRLQRFIVQIPPTVLASLENAGSVEKVQNLFCVLINKDLYRPDIGLYPDNPSYHAIEHLIV